MLNEKEIAALAEALGNLGLPANFAGDRLAAFNAGIARAIRAMARCVSMDAPANRPDADKPGAPSEQG
jgi:hypothetical protein